MFKTVAKIINFFSPLSKIILVLALGTFAYFQAVVIPIDSGNNVKILGGGLKSGGNSIVKGESDQNEGCKDALQCVSTQNNSANNTGDAPMGRLYFAFAKITDPSPSFENYAYISGDLIIKKDTQILRVKPNAIDSEKIAWHAIQAEDLDTSSITSRTIKDGTIQGQDISANADLAIESLTVSGEVVINGASTITGNMDMADNVILNIGSAGTDFTATGGLVLADNLTVTSGGVAINGASTITGNLTVTTLNTGQGAYELYAMDQNVLTTSTPTFAGLTSNGNLILGANTLTTTNANLISNLNADLLDSQQGSYYLNTGTDFAGDVSGIYSAIIVADDSHNHTATTLPATTSYLGQTIESIEITDGTVASVDLSNSISLLAGGTFAYGLGTLTANALDTALTYGVSISGNSTTVSNGLYSTGSYSDPTWLSAIAGTKINSNISTSAANVTGTVSISNGGTGQTSAQTARNALLPTQTANAGKFLQTDGTDTTWQNILWSNLNAPTANLALAMQSYTTTLTYGATTGVANLFNITDTINNSGTGYLVNITTANPSLLKPFSVSAANGVFPAIAVDSTGKVGIGWATPTSQLTVIGGATFGATYATALLSDGKVAIENNLGIGTTDPLAKLDINGDLRLRPLTTAPAVQEGKIYYDGNDKNYKMYNTQTAEYIDLVADPHIQPSECATGYVPVPGDARYGTAGGFCVMKYEAKCDDNADGIGNTTSQDVTYKTWHNDTAACTGAGKAVVSSALGAPIAYISQITAKAYCAALGTGYHLITNNEWMTIARNIDRRGANWTSGIVGTGGIWRGHTDNVPANALEANTDDAQGYEGTGNVTPSIEKRTFTLSNGQTLWDLSGNVWEWNNDTIKRKDEPHSTTAPDNAWNWKELTTIDNYGTTSYASTRPSNPVWNATQNMGRLYTYNPSGDVDTTQYAFLRGGNWINTTNAGLFTLALNYAPTSTNYDIGFRCVFAP